MAYADYYVRDPILPWADLDTDHRFKRMLLASLLVATLFGIIVSFLPVPDVARQELEEVPPRLAKVILERQQRPPPPPPPPKPKPVKKEQPKPKPKAEKKPPVKKEKPKPVKKQQPKPKPKVDTAAAARKKAAQAMAWADELSDLRDGFDVGTLQKGNLAKSADAVTASGTGTESILTARAGSSSGGINTGRMARTAESTKLAKRETAKVSSNIGTKNQSTLGGKKTRTAGRTDEEIQLVFDKNKGAIDRIYTKALRTDPSLEGKLVLKLTIAPSGKVTKISVVSSELNSPNLEKRLMSRIKLFNFGSKNVGTITVTYPVVFLPS